MSILDWLAGDGRYHDLAHCMGHDWLWIGITVSLCALVLLGYTAIALHWLTVRRKQERGFARSANTEMMFVFWFCGVCGYLFTIIKMVWPAWRLHDMALAVLVYFTWRYVFRLPRLNVTFAQRTKIEHNARSLETAREDLHVYAAAIEQSLNQLPAELVERIGVKFVADADRLARSVEALLNKTHTPIEAVCEPPRKA